MIEITNLQKYPVQLVIKSKLAPKTFTTLNLPAIGNKKNKFLLEDERVTIYIEQAERSGLISTREVTNI